MSTSERNTYPHDGVISWDDEFWYSLDREQNNEDQARMTMTAAEYEEYLAECERQEGIDHNPAWVDPSDEVVSEVEDGITYYFIDGVWYAEGQTPAEGGEAYYDEVSAYADELLQEALALAAAQANDGNYLDPLS